MIITINCIGTLLLLIARILRCPTSMFEGFKIVDKTCYTYKENKFLTEEAYRVNQRKKRRTLMSNVRARKLHSKFSSHLASKPFNSLATAWKLNPGKNVNLNLMHFYGSM